MTLPHPPAPAAGFEFLALRGHSRVDQQFSTSSLAADAEAVGTVDLAPGWRIHKVTTNRPARVRLYTSTTQRTLDLSRPSTDDPDLESDHGLLLEVLTETGFLSMELSPAVDGYCPTGVAVPWAVQNKDAGSGIVTVTLRWVRTE